MRAAGPQSRDNGAPAASGLRGFLGTLGQRIASVEREIPRIARQPDNREATRALHDATSRVRRDAEAFGGEALESARALLRGVEGLAQALSDARLSFVPAVGEAILLALDRVRVVAESQETGRLVEPIEVGRVTDALAEAAREGDGVRDVAIGRVIAALTGDGSWGLEVGEPFLIPVATSVDIGPTSVSSGPRASDLRLFREFSLRLESRFAFWEGRTDRLVRFALEANLEAGRPIDPAQLEAAVYMHDVGMAFMSEAFWKKQGPLGEAERLELQGHPALAANLIDRTGRWDEATKIIAQHHERPNGKGYPHGLDAHDITPGARLLSVLDAFEAMTHERADRQSRKSVMRAMAEINACVDQFSRDWVPVFNRVVRRYLAESPTV